MAKGKMTCALGLALAGLFSVAVVSDSVAAPQAATAIDFTSSLVRTVDTAAFSPPSPDPSGLTYLPGSNTLLMTDPDVEEDIDGITHFQGANVWELTLSGAVVRSTNISTVEPTVFPMSEEPSGVAFKPSSGHCFVSDDSQKQIYDMNPGADGACGTGDDSSTFFSTNGVGNADPEGIAYDSWNDRLFVVDGAGSDIYQYTTSGALVGQFDVQAFGVGDPESVEFNPVSDEEVRRTLDTFAAVAAASGLGVSESTMRFAASIFICDARSFDSASVHFPYCCAYSCPPLAPATISA